MEKEPKLQTAKEPFDIFEHIEIFAFAIIAVAILFVFVGRPVYVSGTSMYPTLHDKDNLIISTYNALLGQSPKAGDVVVITKPNSRNEAIIKGVVATEGQVVDFDFQTGQLYVDGQAVAEPYAHLDARPMKSGDMQFPLTVEEGKVFVLGDNRNHSLDSRFSEIGQIDERYVLGTVVYQMFSGK